MIINHLKVAFRQLLKSKFITGVNLLGLVLGITAALFIWQYVDYEYSYDNFHENIDQVYRVRTDRVENGVPFMQFAAGAAFAGPFLNEHFSEVKDYVKLATSSEGVFNTEDGVGLREEKVFYAMPSIFEVFSYSLLRGNPETSLEKPFTACLSESMARKLFGKKDPIGKTVTRNGTDRYEITGIFADCPENAHLKFEVLLSYSTYSDVFYEDQGTETAAYWDGFYAYLLLDEHADPEALEAKIPAAITQHYDEETSESVELHLQALADIHLTSNYLIEAEVNGDAKAVRFLSIIGMIVLFIAWLNYINLSVARSVLRSREVGVRKIVGGNRMRLVSQFLTETFVVNLLALLVSLCLVFILQPSFAALVGKPVSTALFGQPQFWLVCLAVVLIGGLLSGLYPAILVSGFNPIQALKAGFSNRSNKRGRWLQQGLVVVQFTAAVALIASTIIIYNQLQHLQNTDLGLNIDQSLIVKGPKLHSDSTYAEKAKVLNGEILQLAQVQEITGSSSIPGQDFGWTAGGVRRVGQDDQSESFHVMQGRPNFTEVYDMEIVSGRHMSESMRTDHAACLLNEKGAALLGFENSDAAVGKAIEFWGDQFTVVGVVRDFHQKSPKDVTEPLVLCSDEGVYSPSYYTVKLRTEQLSSTLAGIEAVWSSVFPGDPFEFFFLDEHFNLQYEADQRFGRIFTLFSVLAIIVSCLGLFALVAFIAERKRKEIGIRKVLGASVSSIVNMLSKDFVKLVLVALLVATPLAWYFMENWLDNFAVRTDISWTIFLLAGGAAIIIAVLTMSFQGIKAAIANPIDALRNE